MSHTTRVATEPEVDISHTLAPVQARELNGEPIRLGTLWEDRPAVLLFLRHFG